MDTRFKVSCILSEQYSYPEALALLKAWNIACAKPAFSLEELEHSLADAYSRQALADKTAEAIRRQMEWEDRQTATSCEGGRCSYP